MKQRGLTATILNAIGFIVFWLIFSGFFGPNFFLSVFASIVLLVGFGILWRPGESPILLWVFGYQWLQASIGTFWTNIAGEELSALSSYHTEIEGATYLTLFGLLIIAIGMRWGTGRRVSGVAQAANSLALQHSMGKWFNLYLLGLGVAIFAAFAALQIPALSQPILALASFKWAFFFILTYAAFLRPVRERRLWLVAFLIEMFLGFGGYFSSFTKVLVFSILGVLAAGIRFTSGKVFALALLSGLSLCLAILWTAVKVEYRDFVSRGESAQVVSVDYADSLTKLGALVINLDRTVLVAATENFVRRISYVDFFAATLKHVPTVEPHTNGALWLDAVIRPFTPRVFFPSKSEIHDSERTQKYSGISVAGASQGTSISIGYMGESYIDFGPVGMMIPILAFGWLLGRSYRWLVMSAPTCGLVGMGLASATLFTAALLESSITKVFGGLVAALLVAWLLNHFVFPRYFEWLVTGKRRSFDPEMVGPVAHNR